MKRNTTLKHLILMLAVFLTVGIAMNLTSSAAVYGDMNSDGKLNVSDARILLRAAVNIEPLKQTTDEWGSIFGDFNDDGKINVVDARILLRAAVNIAPLTEPETTALPTQKITTTTPPTTRPPITKPTTTEAPETTTEAPRLPYPPESADDIVLLYNSAVNKTKAYKGKVTVDKNEGTNTVLNSITPDISLIRDSANNMLPNDYPTNTIETFTNGTGEDNPDRELSRFLLLSDGAQSTLTAAGVKSASCTPYGDGYKIEIVLIEEKGDGLSYTPPHHSSCVDTLAMTAEDIKPFTMKSVTITYPGASLKAIVNADGLLDSLEIEEPANINGQLAFSLINLIKADLTGIWKQDISFIYDGADKPSPVEPDSVPAEILAIYTEVMNKAKADKPAYKKYEYQEIPSDAANRNIAKGSGYVGTVLGLVDQLNIITSEADAIANPEIYEKNNDMKYFPVAKTDSGCLLTDVNAIKQATYENLSNGNVRITIVLNDENKPEPAPEGAETAPSYTGGMFAPLSSVDIKETLNDGTVAALIKDIYYDLNYHDCTAILEYNPATKQIVSLEQSMVVRIDASCKALLFFPLELTQELYNTMYCYDFAY